MEFIIVTGMSGAGKSRVINSLEDIGFFCADNMPPKLIPMFANLLKSSRQKRPRVAVVTDIRTGISFEDLFDSLDELKRLEYDYKLFFIDAEDSVLIHRYKETRRKHPLLEANGNSIERAVKAERELLTKARMHADMVLDTTRLSATQCRVRVASMFSDSDGISMNIHCMSFGYKYGIPADADFVFDLRFLPNPFYIDELKHKTGFDCDVSDYVMKWECSQKLFRQYKEIIETAIPLCVEEGRSQLVLAFGCTGGRHRSVTFAEKMYSWLNTEGFASSISHRDIEK